MHPEGAKNLIAGLVSIGMPLYNGARFLSAAIDSLLAQDYNNFEILISDNASNDETEAICRAYAAADSRIHYHRWETNRGATWNFTRAYQFARGEYFMWAAHDDLRRPDYVSRCVEALRENPNALFCRTDVKFIDVEGRDVTDTFKAQTLPPVGATPRERLRAISRSTYWVDFYSLFRTRCLADVLPLQDVWGNDVLLVAAICLRGNVVAIPERLFQYRLFFDKSADHVAQTLNIRVSWLHLSLEMLRKIWRAPLDLGDKVLTGWMFLSEFCLLNRTVNGHIREEGFRGVRHAFIHKHLRRAFGMAALGLVLFATNYFQWIWRSVRDPLKTK